jgi:hypothetical protein
MPKKIPCPAGGSVAEGETFDWQNDTPKSVTITNTGSFLTESSYPVPAKHGNNPGIYPATVKTGIAPGDYTYTVSDNVTGGTPTMKVNSSMSK